MNLKEILAQMCLSEQAEATPFKSAEDGTDYAVWKINDGNTAYVLKRQASKNCLFTILFWCLPSALFRTFTKALTIAASYFCLWNT